MMLPAGYKFYTPLSGHSAIAQICDLTGKEESDNKYTGESAVSLELVGANMRSVICGLVVSANYARRLKGEHMPLC